MSLKGFKMRVKLAVMALLLLGAAPVWAQGNHTITVIHEDGTKDVVDLRQSAPQPEPVKAPFSSKVMSSCLSESVTAPYLSTLSTSTSAIVN